MTSRHHLHRVWNFLISFGEDASDQPDRRASKQIFSVGVWGSIPATTLLCLELARQDAPWASLTLGLVTLLLVGWLVTVRIWPRSFDATVQVIILSSNIGPLIPTLLLGGLSAGGFSMVWGFVGVGA